MAYLFIFPEENGTPFHAVRQKSGCSSLSSPRRTLLLANSTSCSLSMTLCHIVFSSSRQVLYQRAYLYKAKNNKLSYHRFSRTPLQLMLGLSKFQLFLSNHNLSSRLLATCSPAEQIELSQELKSPIMSVSYRELCARRGSLQTGLHHLRLGA